jgi:hypothetical protein
MNNSAYRGKKNNQMRVHSIPFSNDVWFRAFVGHKEMDEIVLKKKKLTPKNVVKPCYTKTGMLHMNPKTFLEDQFFFERPFRPFLWLTKA